MRFYFHSFASLFSTCTEDELFPTWLAFSKGKDEDTQVRGERDERKQVKKKTSRSQTCLVHQTSHRKPMQGSKGGGVGDAGMEGLMDGGRVRGRECLMSGRS